jgi:hypothetical protein
MSDEEPIFAWTYDWVQYRRFGRAGLLAPSPDVFVNIGDIVEGELSIHRHSYTMTNRGLQLKHLSVVDNHVVGNKDGLLAT